VNHHIHQISVSCNNRAPFLCPRCGWSQAIDVGKYLNAKREIRLKVRCKCGYVCIVSVDRRRYFRKETDLYGNFIRVELPGSFFQERTGAFGEMTVTNLSKGGVRFKPFDKVALALEDEVRVEFHLDDLNRSRILKQAKVKCVNGYGVGAEYIRVEPTDFSDQAIAYYLVTCK